MDAEVTYLGKALNNPDRPFVAILGGAKVSDKLEVIENLLGKVDALLIGGAMAYTFLKARGIDTGHVTGGSRPRGHRICARRACKRDGRPPRTPDRSRRRPEDLRPTRRHVSWILIPRRFTRTDRLARTWASTSAPRPSRTIARLLPPAKTVVWNGPMGVFEMKPFAAGTMGVAAAVADVDGTTIIGGGDSVAAVAMAGVADRMTHISTGGGASLEFLGGQVLPGVAALA